jgi:TP901 family phage tail tape measure protein
MAMNNFGLGLTFTARNLASGAIRRLKGEVTGLGAASGVAGAAMSAGFGVAAAGIAPLVVGVTGLAASLSLANAAGEFETGIQKVANISGATAEELGLLRDAAIEAGLNTQFSPDEATEGLANLAAQGFNASNSITMLDSSLALAAGGQISIGQATATSAAALRVFSLAADEGGMATDKLLKITNLTALQAGDLEIALGTVARGASITKQSLDEMLISMGLVKNTGVDASVAASSVSSALLFAAQNAKKFSGIGVSLTDNNGEFRSFLDIVGDTSKELDKVENAAERVAMTTDLFGRFGTNAFAGISNQLKEMVKREPDIKTIEDAVAHLRFEMASAEGTAVEFSNRLLDTFGGQKKILQGAMQTMAVLLGEPFAKVFKPVIFAIAQSLSAVARLINSMPEEFKVAVAAFVVLSSAILAASGALTVFIGLGMVVGAFLFPLLVKGATIFALVLFPLVGGILAMAAAFGALYIAARENVGGLGDFISGLVDKTKLAFNAIRQLFSDGFVSGKTAEALLDPANKGVLNFVRTIFQVGKRIVAFVQGIGAGFAESFGSVAPKVEGLVDAFKDVLEILGITDSTAGSLGGMDKFAASGAAVGLFLVDVFGFVVDGLKRGIKFIYGFIQGAKDAIKSFVAFDVLKSRVSLAADEIKNLFIQLGFGSSEAGGDIQSIGSIFGKVFGFMMGVGTEFVIAFVNGIRFAINVFQAFMDMPRVFAKIWISVATTIENVIASILNYFDEALMAIGELAAKIPVGFRTGAVESVIDMGIGANQRINQRLVETGQRDRERDSRLTALDDTASVEQARIGAAGNDQSMVAGHLANLAGSVRAMQKSQQQKDDKPLVVNLIADAEKIATVVTSQNRRRASQAFVPVPAAVE